jgi:hypothetical protein
MASLVKHLRKRAIRIVEWFGILKVKIPALAAQGWELLFGRELRCSRRTRTVHLELESLEGRIQLSTFKWIGFQPDNPLSNTLASNPQNWILDGVWTTPNQAPGAGDDVVFTQKIGAPAGFAQSDCIVDANFGTTVKSITVDDSFKDDKGNARTITLNNDLLVTTTANIGGGAVAGNGLLEIGDNPPITPAYAATLNWSGGVLGGTTTSSVIIGSSSTANITQNNITDTATKTLDGRSIVNYGTLNWDTWNDLSLKNSAGILDYSTMNINAKGAGSIKCDDGTGAKFQVKTGAALNVNPGPTLRFVDVKVPFRNDGTVSIDKKWLSLDGGSYDTGTFWISIHALLYLDLTDHTLDGATVSGSGILEFDSSRIHLNGTVTVQNVNDLASLVDDSGGSTLIVNTMGTYNWAGGKWAGSGETDIPKGSLLNLMDPIGTDAAAYDLERKLVNDGTVTWTKAADITITNDGSIDNKLGATFDIQVGQQITDNSDDLVSFTNGGVLKKSAGGTTIMDIPFIPQPGSQLLGKQNLLDFRKTVALLGDVEVDVGAAIAFDGGAELDGGSVTNNGTITAVGDVLQKGGDVADAGTITTTGNWLYNAGTFALSAGTLTANNLDVAVGVVFSGYGSVYANVLNDGEIDTVSGAPSPLYVYGSYTQLIGTQQNPSVTNVKYGATLQVTGLVDVQGGTVNVDGNGSNLIALANFSQENGWVDLNLGMVNVTGVYAESGGLTTLEAGTLTADGSGDPSGYGLQVTNYAVLSGYGFIKAGTFDADEIDVVGGTLAVTGGYKQTGTTNVASNATLSVTGMLDEQAGALNMADSTLHVYGGYLIESAALLDGGGSLIADVTNSGTIECGSATALDGFVVLRDTTNNVDVINGNFAQTATGVLDMKIGGVNAYDRLGVNGTVSLGGTLNLNLIDGYVPSPNDQFFMIQGNGSGGFAAISLPTENNGTFVPKYNWDGMAFYVYFQGNYYYH